MKVTLLGHASILFELDGANVLMDPVFADPFSDGAVVGCPAREVFPERLPRIDFVVISHGHLDHFDIPSLARLSRRCEVLCPEDPVLPYALGKLGFERVRTLRAGTFLDFGSWQMLTTYSDTDVVEVGVVFRDRDGTCWNEVDSVVNAETIGEVQSKMGHVDLLFSGYASQNVGFFETMRSGYPLGLTRMNLANVRRISPALVVPGSAGYRFAGYLEWTNPFLFPISRDHFVKDLARVAPELPSVFANPGDVFEVRGRSVVRHAGASDRVRMIVDDTDRVAFDATAPIPPLTDPNPLGYSDGEIDAQVRETVGGVVAFVRAAYAGSTDPLVEQYRRSGFAYALGIVFPDGHERWWHFRFEPDAAEIAEAKGPPRGAIATHRIAASILTARARYEKGYLYYRGFSRLTQTDQGTDVDPGNVVHEAREPDLLGYYLANKAPGADRAAELRMDYMLAKYFDQAAQKSIVGDG